jgi:hypothetical protein
MAGNAECDHRHPAEVVGVPQHVMVRGVLLVGAQHGGL